VTGEIKVRLRATRLTLNTELTIETSEGASIDISRPRSELSTAHITVSELLRLSVDLTDREGRFILVVARAIALRLVVVAGVINIHCVVVVRGGQVEETRQISQM
jgi:hypothetical protein